MAHGHQNPNPIATGIRVATLAGALLAVAASIVCQWAAAAPPTKSRSAPPQQHPGHSLGPTPWITVGKDTTYVTQPVGPDGYIDYLAAINAASSAGVTVENNAAVLLVRAVEITSYKEPDRRRFFKILGVDPPHGRLDQIKENSAFLSNQGDRFGETVASMVPWSPDQFPPRAKWLRNHESALELAVEATGRTRCYFPLIKTAAKEMTYDILLAGLEGSHEAGRALAAQALLRIHEGRIGEARRDLLACHRLARLIGNGLFLMHGRVGRAIEIKASLADAALLEYGNLSAADALAYRAELQKLRPLTTVARQLGHGDRLLILGFATDLAQKQQPELEGMAVSLAPFAPDVLLDLLTDQMTVIWNEAMRTLNKEWDRWAEAAGTPITSGRRKQIEILEAQARPFAKDSAEAHSAEPLQQRGRWMGRMLVTKLMPAFKDAVLIEDRMRMRADLVQLGLALAAYRADVGEYPAALDELVPRYCAELPVDRFTGVALRYRRQNEGYLLYSVGDNGVDDGGRDSDFQPPGDDIVIRVSGKPTASDSSTVGAKQRRFAILLSAFAMFGALAIGGFWLFVRARSGRNGA